MTMKRSRSSSSFRRLPEDRTWNTRVATTATAAERWLMERDSVKKSLKQTVMSDDSGSPIGILTVSSPPVASVKERKERDGGGRGGGDGGCVEAFYEKCALCEKKIDHGDDVFMYSYLRAFCSSNCRIKQIIMDAKKITSQVKKETKPAPSSKNNAIRLFGVQVAEAHSAPQSHVNLFFHRA